MNEAFRARGKTFDDGDVARCYAFRPPYPDALFQTVLARVHTRAALLDLGTGPGKIAGALASRFDQVTAVDPSQPMLDVAKLLWSAHRNIDWVCATTEDAPLSRTYDLITAGASIHWMNPAIIFPKLARLLADRGIIAIIVGDFPHDPPWQSAWPAFVGRWAERLGDKYEPENWRASYAAHEPWIDADETQTFIHAFSQDIEDFIECQHSRASWARRKVGPDLSAVFDNELRQLLALHAREGMLQFNVKTDLMIGKPRATAVARSV